MRPARSRLLESSRTAGISFALAVDLHLPEDHAGVVFHRRDHHPAPVFGLLRGTSQVLPVHGDRRMCRAVLAGPLTDGVVQGLGRQRGEDVVEGGDCGRGVALLARAPQGNYKDRLTVAVSPCDGAGCKKWLRIVADLSGVAVFVSSGWGSAYTWISKDKAMTLGFSIPVGMMPGIYLAVAASALVLLAHVSLPRIRAWRNRKADRFRELAVLLESYAFGVRRDVAGIRELHLALAELGIEYPVEGLEPDVRRLVSADLLAACKAGNLKHARSSWERRGKMPVSPESASSSRMEATP